MARLLAIPPEVMDVIREFVDDNDLKALRTTCRDLCTIFNKRFAEAYLSNLSLVLCEYSLRSILDLVDHPVLGQHIESITFGTHYLPYHDKLSEKLQARAKAQAQFIDRNEHVAMLSEALRRLNSHSISVRLGIHDDLAKLERKDTMESMDVLLQKGYGFDICFGDLRDFSFLRPDAGRTFRSICQAAHQAEYSISRMQMNLCDQVSFPLWGIEQDSTHRLDGAIDDFLSIAAPSQGFSLMPERLIIPGKSLTFVSHIPSAGTASSVLLNTHGPRFVFSTLGADASEDIDSQRKARFDNDFLHDCGSILDACFYTTGLREVSLSKCCVDMEFLLHFLRDQQGSLRWLVLRELDVDFPEEDDDPEGQQSPLALLVQIRNMSHLEFLMMQELKSKRDTSRGIGPRLGMFQGKRIQPALRTYIQREDLINNFVQNDQPIPDGLIDPEIPEAVRARLTYYDDPDAE
ncbi:hypothetical protein AUEXF2481DRAFT_2593 [Aureobasidium subglaciale EXF-2481]|uniref:F-box domain-containing protein n=1 Tax=Aureobasidium subglaciale (strain EXF-2481) TaxID=1043005 RepID=A0A074ZGG9_AURSE|nr:uncharacterized protein AUEXF2481DRAFT_2593 [Aureobasidium subglaciale EXF-2481]KAI5195073.1 hypothetical protein E4T38_09275 [Aureobasidium subglaciale]KAI5214117.1 hypothetical protein E4T40_09226 [Aureobasidium subglaciale]KAI5216572.1 hypothetical protein E4T41_09227 [Aureobasidium subglaciale]KAI5254465.1 hypothetical protein E4T46_09182 [Aureobasidium subglaciale]KEQ97656.1 hypothetical protein AUEXF2481DRAFT_2593 [Aureobasidium subglaciale EXF-2481]